MFAMCMAFVVTCFGQEVAHTINEYADKVSVVATFAAGTLSTILSEVLNKYLGAKKTNALIVSLSVAIGVVIALVTFGVPNLGIASVFTISSALFAVWRKVENVLSK